MPRSRSHDAPTDHPAGRDPARSGRAHATHAAHGHAHPHPHAHDPQDAVDVARSVATLMERMRQLKHERDAARADAGRLRDALPSDHPLKIAPDEGGIADISAVPTRVDAADAGDVECDSGVLREELAKALAEKEEYLALARRVQAELDNYRKRIQRDLANQRRDALKNFLREFLGAFDDLDRVLAESEKDPAAATVRQGVQLARDNLWRTLEKSGVLAIPALGMPFDPQFHEAMTAIPSPDHPANTVLEVYQPGYTLDDFVLRPARVVVSSATPAGD